MMKRCGRKLSSIIRDGERVSEEGVLVFSAHESLSDALMLMTKYGAHKAWIVDGHHIIASLDLSRLLEEAGIYGHSDDN